DGKEVYGYEIEGKWLECGNKLAYSKSNLYLSLKHPKFGPELKKYLKKDYNSPTTSSRSSFRSERAPKF
ncbi:unnamed protein product, partial [marine sediment metagenome]